MPDDELKNVIAEIVRVERLISLLPEAKQRPYETRLEELKRRRAELEEAETPRARLSRLAGEIERLRHTLGIDLEEIRAHIAALMARVEEKVLPEDVEQVRRMVGELRTFHEGLLLPWRRGISKELEERALWASRIAKGEAVLEARIEGAYAVYESYHHLPTSQRWVKTIG